MRAFIERIRRLADRAIPPEILGQRPIDLHRARLLVTASVIASATAATTSLTIGFAGPMELPATAAAVFCFAMGIPLLWWNKAVDLATSTLPAGLFAYCVISTAGSGGALPFAALLTPIASLAAGLLCTRAAAVAWFAAFCLALPLAAVLSPEAHNVPAMSMILLGVGLLFAAPILLSVLTYRGLYEQVLTDNFDASRREREATLRQAQLDARLRETERLVSLARMAGGIAHEINNILTAIGGSAELLALSPLAGVQEREHTARIGSSVDRAADLVKQLLDFTGRGRRKLERISLRRRVEASARILAAGLSKDVALRVSVRDDAWLFGDAVQMDQLVVHLVQNAARAYGGKPGTIDVELDRMELGAPSVTQPSTGLPAGAYAVLRVTDRGCGISPEDAPRIFDPFFANFEGGRGLGLAAALGIALGHGGGIAVESALSAGTTLSIYLPCDADTEERRVAEPFVATSSPIALRDLRLLVVDDEPAVREVLVQRLRGAGAAVHEARDGAEALELLARIGPVDAALVDVSMPRVSGTQLLEALRASGRNFPVVLMTGHADVEIARFGPEARVAVLLKPFRLEEIPAALARAHGAEGLPARSAAPPSASASSPRRDPTA